MTNDQFKDWRKSLKLTKAKAAKALGISVASVSLYERGRRFDNDEPVEIPKTVELACACLSRACLTTEAVAFSKAWAACEGKPHNADLCKLDLIATNIDLAISGHQHGGS